MSNKSFEEKAIFLILGIIFTGVLGFVLVHFFSAYKYMAANSLFLFVLATLSIAGAGVSWYKSLSNFDDPNYDYWRKVLFVCLVIGIAIIGAYGSQHAADVSDGLVSFVH